MPKFAPLESTLESRSALVAFRRKNEWPVEFKRFSLLTQSGWGFHAWIDSFLQELERDFDTEAFFSRISWETSVTVGDIIATQPGKTRSKVLRPGVGTPCSSRAGRSGRDVDWLQFWRKVRSMPCWPIAAQRIGSL
jgi:hypothetical protein